MLDKLTAALALKCCEHWARPRGLTSIPPWAPSRIKTAWAIAIVVFDVEARDVMQGCPCANCRKELN